MKALIWIGCFLGYTFLNLLLGEATGFRAGWLIFYAAWFYTSKGLCKALDDRREQKRLDKEWRERQASRPVDSFVNKNVSVPTPAAVSQVTEPEPPKQRPQGLPHYGAMQQQEDENGRNVFLYRLGKYDMDFCKKCAQALLSQAKSVTGVILMRDGIERNIPAEGLDILSHPAFDNRLTGIQIKILDGLWEMTIYLTVGSDSIKIVASPKIGQDAILLRLDSAVHQVLTCVRIS